jgi:Ca2+-dependent lipid-binding protein
MWHVNIATLLTAGDVEDTGTTRLVTHRLRTDKNRSVERGLVNSHRNSSKSSRMPTTDQIEAALAALALQKIPNYKQTLKEYGVCRTTLSRHSRELQTLLSSQQQITLVSNINELSEAGILPSPSMVQVFVFEINADRSDTIQHYPISRFYC